MSSLTTPQSDTFLTEKDQWLARASATYELERTALVEELSSNAVTKKKTIQISGFSVPTTDDNEIYQLRLSLVNEIGNANAVRETLQNAGITPIAILPKSIFRSLMTEAQLYSFYTMNEKNEVKGDGGNFYNKYSFGESINEWLFFFILIGNVIGTGCLGYLFGHHAYFIGLAIFQFIIGAATVWAAYESDEDPSSVGTGIYLFTAPHIAFARFIYKRNIKRNAAKYLWPDFIDEGKEKEDRFKIILPIPPVNIQQKLIKCHQANIKTFVVADRTAFKVVLDSDTMTHLKDVYSDPIIAYQSQGMVAVIDQFGDFAGEKKVMKYIEEHFNAIRRDLFPLQQN